MKDKLKVVFTQCDANNSGYVEQDELATLFSKMNVTMDDKSFHNVVAKFDTNKDGRFSLPEFEEMLVFVLGERNKAMHAKAGAPPPAVVASKAPAQAKQAAAPPSPVISKPASNGFKVEIKSHQQQQQDDLKNSKTLKAPKKLSGIGQIKARFGKISGTLKERHPHDEHDLSVGQFEDPKFAPSDSVCHNIFTGNLRNNGVVVSDICVANHDAAC